MADISNKFLVFLLVIAIFVSVIGTWYSIDRVNKLASITGSDVFGYVNITTGTHTEINVTQPYCGFGSGYVTPGYDFAVIAPSSGGTCGFAGNIKENWTNTSDYDPQCMRLENLGNTFVEINVSSAKTIENFIGGSSPNVTVWSNNPPAAITACVGTAIPYPGVEMNTSNVTVCTNFTKALNSYFYVGCRLKIPKDAPIETKTDIWTFTGTAI